MTSPRRLADALRTETVGGVLLLAAAAVALLWANSPWSEAYGTVRRTEVWGLDLQHWSSDGLLAVFFLVAGLELKRELVVGELSEVRRAVVPVAAACGGVVVPALLYLAVNAQGGDLRGWAVPTATDIAFALAVLAVAGRRLPSAFRAFLLTLAVVDDLIAIVLIATLYASGPRPALLAAALLPLVAFALVARSRLPAQGPLLLVLGLLVWVAVHESGVHATVAGVLLGFALPVRSGDVADRVEHLLRPVSAGVAVPVFALLASGVPLQGVRAALDEPVALGVALGLVAGKAVGVSGATWLAVRWSGAALDPALRGSDVLALSVVSGVGFTVSLLVADLALAGAAAEAAVVGVLLGSLVAALLSLALLPWRARAHERRRPQI